MMERYHNTNIETDFRKLLIRVGDEIKGEKIGRLANRRGMSCVLNSSGSNVVFALFDNGMYLPDRKGIETLIDDLRDLGLERAVGSIVNPFIERWGRSFGMRPVESRPVVSPPAAPTPPSPGVVPSVLIGQVADKLGEVVALLTQVKKQLERSGS